MKCKKKLEDSVQGNIDCYKNGLVISKVKSLLCVKPTSQFILNYFMVP